jgi:hypothetical protein
LTFPQILGHKSGACKYGIKGYAEKDISPGKYFYVEIEDFLEGFSK